LPFFHIFQIISLFSSMCSISFHYSNLSSIFSNVFQLSETNINSYDIFFMYTLS
jgi:hypothetical protein